MPILYGVATQTRKARVARQLDATATPSVALAVRWVHVNLTAIATPDAELTPRVVGIALTGTSAQTATLSERQLFVTLTATATPAPTISLWNLSSYAGVRYESATGKIIAVLLTSEEYAISLNAEDEGHAVLQVDRTHEVVTYPDRYVVVAEALVAKTEVTLTPDFPEFVADGARECTITLSGMVNDVTLFIWEMASLHVIPLGDPTLVLTSDTPQTFTIHVLDSVHWGEVVTVEAVSIFARTLSATETPAPTLVEEAL